MVSLLATVFGLAYAIRQVRLATSAAQAAERAINSTTKRLALNSLLVLIAQLQASEQALHLAIAKDEPASARVALVQWRQLANHLRGQLEEGSRDGYEHVVIALRQSVALIATAESAMDGGTKSVRDATRRVREEIANASDELGALLAQLRLDPGD